VSMVDSEGNDAGNLFVQLKWKYPYKKRSKPVEAHKPIVASELIGGDDEIQVPKKKKSARKSLENYLHERNSDTGSVKSQASVKSVKSTKTIPEEPIYVTPPKSPEVPKSETPEVQPEVEPVDLDDTLPADKTLPPEPDIESDKNSENEGVDEPSAETVDEEIIDDVIDEEVVEEELQSVHSAATEASGIQFKEEKPISDTISTPRGSVASMTSQKSKKSIQKSYSPVIIQIKRLEIVENGPVKDNNVFIEFDFCGEVEETNESLPFPTEENPSHFDFRKEFNFKYGGSKYNHLYSMLLPHESASSSIKFTLVDDPGDNDDEDCQELGTAYVDIKQCKFNPYW